MFYWTCQDFSKTKKDIKVLWKRGRSGAGERSNVDVFLIRQYKVTDTYIFDETNTKGLDAKRNESRQPNIRKWKISPFLYTFISQPPCKCVNVCKCSYFQMKRPLLLI